MSIRLCSMVVLVGTAAVLVGCQNNPSQPAGPSAVSAAQSSASAGAPQLAAKGASQHVVTLSDACDPQTFDAALGPGTCTRSGGVRFDAFLDLLGKHQSIGGWHVAPSEVTMQVGEMLVAMNHGGETHTFTEVEEFGGGIVPLLNQLTGLTEVAPECKALQGKDFLAPGASSSEKEEEAGVEKYQCCIHPWMRAQVRVSDK